MTAGDTAVPAGAALRVARGRPTPPEIAAVAAVVLAARRPDPAGEPPAATLHRRRPVWDTFGPRHGARSWESWEIP